MAYTILMIEDDSNFYENVNQYNKDNKLHYDIKRIKSTEDLQFFFKSKSCRLSIIFLGVRILKRRKSDWRS